MKKKFIRLLPALITIIVAGVVFCCLQRKKEAPVITDQLTIVKEPERSDTDQKELFKEDPHKDEIWVYVCGSVYHPGVYCLDQGSRVFEAIEMAGGMTDEAAEGILNLATQVQDGQQIFVPGVEDVLPNEENDPEEQDGRININTASLQELMSLPGIGETKASAIIAYRNKTPFRTIEEIMNVSGIKENSFRKIQDLIKV